MCPGFIYATMTSMKAYPAYQRSRSRQVVGGVAAGLSAHLGVDVLHVRIAFVVLAALNSLGVVLYAMLWATTKQGVEVHPVSVRHPPKATNLLLLAVGVVVAFGSLSALGNVPGAVLLALVVAGVGAYLAWSGMDKASTSRARIGSLAAGAVLVIAGLLGGLFASTPQDFLVSVFAVLVTLAGVAVFALPWGVRVRSSLQEKAAAEERAIIASRLHDSVLQTLALIQKRSDDPAEVTRLARAQERELRTWLFEPKEAPMLTLFGAIEKAAGEVEDMYGVRIAPVVVGDDEPLTETTQAVVLAAREAMVNAAKHSGEQSVDVYAENLGGREIFVRDRGGGFDVDKIPADRHGIRDSIYARVERVGGTVSITSAPGEGTEVIISV